MLLLIWRLHFLFLTCHFHCTEDSLFKGFFKKPGTATPNCSLSTWWALTAGLRVCSQPEQHREGFPLITLESFYPTTHEHSPNVMVQSKCRVPENPALRAWCSVVNPLTRFSHQLLPRMSKDSSICPGRTIPDLLLFPLHWLVSAQLNNQSQVGAITVIGLRTKAVRCKGEARTGKQRACWL